MSKDMLGPATRALVGVPQDRLNLIAKIANRLSGKDGVRWAHAYSQTKFPETIIDCDAAPFIPEGWTVEQHQQDGQLAFDPSQVEFYLSDSQKNGRYIVGNKLRKELADKPVLNANVLDYLLAKPDLIPEEWKKDELGNTRGIFFWGTVYRHRSGSLCVRCLYWGNGRWHWSSHWLHDAWYRYYPALLRAS